MPKVKNDKTWRSAFMPESHKRVLIVDDEYYLGQMLAQALLQEKIEAMAVTDIDSAISWLERKKFDLIVSDVYLPGKTGMDLFNYVTAHNIEVPFIFMTGNPNLEMAIDFLTRGGYDYILKPFMIPEFIHKVKSVIKTHSLRKKEKKLVKDLRQLLASRLSELRIFQDVIESTDDGVLVTDVEGTIVKVNAGFEKITGLSSVQLLQQHLDVLRQTVLPGLDFKTILQELEANKTWNGELVGGRNHQDTWYVSITFSPVQNEESQIFAYAGIFKDVTEQREVEQALISSLQKMNLAQEAIIFGLANLAEQRDNITGFHLERIRAYCKALAEALYERHIYPHMVNAEFINMLYRTAPLHDIGKVGIPDYILLKKGRLSPAEFEIIKSHTTIGYNTLNSIRKQYGDMQFLKMGIEITYCHHERWDGNGYPRGLKGKQIPLSAQILAIADVYDALTTSRSYKSAFGHREAIEIMKKERGKHFSPKIFDVFLKIADRFDQIRMGFAESVSAVELNLPVPVEY